VNSPGSPPRLWRSWLLLTALATVFAAGASVISPAARQVLLHGGLRPDEIRLEAVRTHRGSLIWLDARPDAAFAQEHIPEALPLNEDRWDVLIDPVLLRWQPGTWVIVYCDDTACAASRHVADRLRRDYRLDNVWVLHGGWAAWEKAMSP
jgi:rhodanese-related sulfurtransferase